MKFLEGYFRKESTEFKPFDYKTKKGKTLFIRMDGDSSDDLTKRNRLFLKVEIRKYSSNTICCYIYSPFLVYNETESRLRFKSSKRCG